jgi:chromosome partitioning protein
MKIVATINQKGGTGKTMLSTNLAVASVLAGHTTALIDLDPQCSAMGWSDKRGTKTPAVIATPAPRLQHWLDLASDNGATLAFIDTAPNIGSPVLEAARAADFVLVPSRAGDVDLEAIPPTMEVIKMAKTRASVVLNAVKCGSNLGIEGREKAKELGLPCAPFVIGERVGFVRAFNKGESITEYEPNSESAREIQCLWKFVEKELEV